jgi:hypothetical protein
MADVKISGLPASTTPLAGTEVLPVVQSTTTKQVSVANLTAGRAVSAASLALTGSPLPVGSGGSGTATAFTAGSVVFAGVSGVYSQDNANLFWDDSNNRLGIGTTTPSEKLQINNGRLRFLESGQRQWNIGSVSSTPDFAITDATFSATILTLSNPNVTVNLGNLVIGTSGKGIDTSSAIPVTFNINNVEAARIHASRGVSIGNTTDPGATNLSVTGNVVLATSGKGIDFSATAGTGTSELLADYEEGTWTPGRFAYGAGSALPTFTNFTSSGKYTKIGRQVFVSGVLSWTGTSGGAGFFGVDGLPFSVDPHTMQASMEFDSSFGSSLGVAEAIWDAGLKPRTWSASAVSQFKFGCASTGGTNVVTDLSCTSLLNTTVNLRFALSYIN